MGKVAERRDVEPEFGVPDDESPLWTDEDFARAEPFPAVAKRMGWKIPGRPKAEVTKQAISLRLDREIVEHFKAGGPGWQTRINEVLGRHVKNARRKRG